MWRNSWWLQMNGQIRIEMGGRRRSVATWILKKKRSISRFEPPCLFFLCLLLAEVKKETMKINEKRKSYVSTGSEGHHYFNFSLLDESSEDSSVMFELCYGRKQKRSSIMLDRSSFGRNFGTIWLRPLYA